jgi:2-iminobutanoate/2-iminopropanoate deaminase
MEFVGGAGDVSAQTEQVMQNMGAILKAGGSSFADVVKCTILLTDMKHFAAVNEVYAKCTQRPTSCCRSKGSWCRSPAPC